MITGWRRPCAWGGGLAVAVLPSCTGAAGPATGCHGGWQVQAGAAGSRESDELPGVSAAASGDVWAVGSSFDGRWYRPLVEHGVGGRWSSAPTPGIPGYDSHLMGVAGFASGELWAVGSASRGAGPQRVLILHRCASSPS